MSWFRRRNSPLGLRQRRASDTISILLALKHAAWRRLTIAASCVPHNGHKAPVHAHPHDEMRVRSTVALHHPNRIPEVEPCRYCLTPVVMDRLVPRRDERRIL